MLGDKSFIKLISNIRKVRDFSVKEDIMYQTPEGFMEVRIQHVKFSKQKKSGDMLAHDARIITYVDVHKHKLLIQLTMIKTKIQQLELLSHK